MKVEHGSKKRPYCRYNTESGNCQANNVWQGKLTFSKHQKKHCQAAVDLNCYVPDCHDKFFFNSELKSHIEKVHQNSRFQSHICGICKDPSLLKNLNDFLAHKCTVDYKLHCRPCLVPFIADIDGNLEKNVKFNFCPIHQPKEAAKISSHKQQFTCTVCYKILKTKSNLKEHILALHIQANTNKDASTFDCNPCSKTFKTKKRLKNHNFAIHTDSTFSCTYCQHKFNNQSNLQSHIAFIHRNEKKFKCENNTSKLVVGPVIKCQLGRKKE